MYSNIVYLNAESFIPQAKALDFKEELSNGIKVNQKQLAEMEVLAALLYLQSQKLVTISLKESKVLFVKTVKVVVTKTQNSGSLSGLELGIYNSFTSDADVHYIIFSLLKRDSMNPWAAVLNFVKQDLVKRGYLQVNVETKAVILKSEKIVQLKHMTNEDINLQSIFNQDMNQIKNQSELWNKLLSSIQSGIYSRKIQND